MLPSLVKIGSSVLAPGLAETNGQTDGNRETKADLGPRAFRFLFALCSLGRLELVRGPVTQQTEFARIMLILDPGSRNTQVR